MLASLGTQSQGREPMTIFEYLKADHDAVKEMLQEILDTEHGRRRGELFRQLKTDLSAHNRAEEKVFYKRLEKTEEGKDEALEGEVEHEVATRVLEELARSRNKEADRWTARCKVLQELVEHHVEEEESKVFAAARKVFDKATLEEIGEAFAAEKRKIGGVPAAEKEAMA